MELVDPISGVFDLFGPDAITRTLLIIVAGLLYRLVRLYAKQQKKQDEFELQIDNQNYRKRLHRLIGIFRANYYIWLLVNVVVLGSTSVYLLKKDYYITQRVDAYVYFETQRSDSTSGERVMVAPFKKLFSHLVLTSDFRDGPLGGKPIVATLDTLTSTLVLLRILSTPKVRSSDSLIQTIPGIASYLSRHLSNSIERTADAHFQVVDESSKVAAPNVPLVLALALVASLPLSLILIYAVQALDLRVLRRKDIEAEGIPIAGTIACLNPVIATDFEGRDYITVDGKTYSTNMIALLNPLSPISESFRKLRMSLLANLEKSTGNIVTVTGGSAGIGKTTITANLAIALAQSGRTTLILGTDLRRPMLHSYLGRNREPGLINKLWSDGNYTIVSSEIDDLHCCFAGKIVPNPAEILQSQRFHDFLHEVRKDFDVVIMDSPPLNSVIDGHILVGLSDVAILVTVVGDSITTLSRTITNINETINALPTPPTLLLVLNDRQNQGKKSNMVTFGGSVDISGFGYGYGYGYGPID